MATCFDDPRTIFESRFCLDAISKNVKGTVKVVKELQVVCETEKCVTFRTLSALKVATTTNKPCDSKLALRLDGGSLVVDDLATAYENDGLQRGIHAGDFVWTGQHVQIKGRMSGITNAGILRAPLFKPACEACSAPGIMIGRLCGQVVGSAGAGLDGAQVMAVYRILGGKPSKTGANGPATGTIEGVIVGPPCK
jgi:hypothetical protein